MDDVYSYEYECRCFHSRNFKPFLRKKKKEQIQHTYSHSYLSSFLTKIYFQTSEIRYRFPLNYTTIENETFFVVINRTFKESFFFLCCFFAILHLISLLFYIISFIVFFSSYLSYRHFLLF